MHSHPGIVAGLATAIIAITVEPAAADPGPTLPLPAVEVSIGMAPDSSPTTPAAATTATTAADPAAAAKPEKKKTKTAGAEPTGTAPTTRETAVRSTNGARGSSSAARNQTAATHVPAPTPTLRPATIEPPQAATVPNGSRNGLRVDRWFDLAALTIVALLAMALTSRRGRPRATPPPGLDPDPMGGVVMTPARIQKIVDSDDLPPAGLDPASIAAARRIARRLDECS